MLLLVVYYEVECAVIRLSGTRSRSPMSESTKVAVAGSLLTMVALFVKMRSLQPMLKLTMLILWLILSLAFNLGIVILIDYIVL